MAKVNIWTFFTGKQKRIHILVYSDAAMHTEILIIKFNENYFFLEIKLPIHGSKSQLSVNKKIEREKTSKVRGFKC